jgi:hypothetical protein
VAFYFGVLRDESFPLAGSTRRQRPTLDQRLEAAAWLADTRMSSSVALRCEVARPRELE